MKFLSFLLLVYLIILSSFDFQIKKIPNKILISLFLLIFCNDIKYFYYQIPLKLLTGLFFFLIMFLVSALTKGLGMGDVKLAAVIGYATGFFETCFTFLIAAFIGCIFFIIKQNKIRQIPFAPFITFGFVLSQILCRRLNGIF